ncbi:[FeFe] hydrogenase H-cluster radical SAM maturase HydE [Maridesulfovibrio frigidus]|uniref:[FeFe] hydrogenase H-cluster radical SAM maturase HydE n=1 Tax=Maridesulfovibrio frigidus TaxID=340956 RepID=UPI0004E1BE81|nr:[FeFe] hydrogenase H-cluster radical SAM maturase HydE [Maridesulfovibrio frigidus]
MRDFSEDKILAYLNGCNDNELFKLADKLCRAEFLDQVYLRAIVEFSNFCNKKCKYCGLRALNSEITRYRLDDQTIIAAASLAALNGAGTIVLQSGDDFSYSTERIGEIVRNIKRQHDVAVTLSVGDRGIDEYEYWFRCGADRCLIKLETTDPDIYQDIRCGESFAERLRLVKGVKEIGYEVGAGIITGLPGYTPESLLQDILFLTSLELDMIAAGPFIPHPETPFSSSPSGDTNMAYRVTALLRLLNQSANIPATSALDSLIDDGRKIGLTRGCNVIMPSVTPTANRADYNIYPGKNAVSLDGDNGVVEAKDMIRSLNLVPSASKGFSNKKVST